MTVAYWEGYEFHQREVRTDPTLLSWILKKRTICNEQSGLRNGENGPAMIARRCFVVAAASTMVFELEVRRSIA